MIYTYNGRPITAKGLEINGVWQPYSYYENLSDAERAKLGITAEEPVVSTPQPHEKKVFTLAEWMARFTQTERNKFYTLLAKPESDIEVIALNQTILTHPTIDIEDAETIAGLELLQVKGVITTVRKAELLQPDTIEV